MAHGREHRDSLSIQGVPRGRTVRKMHSVASFRYREHRAAGPAARISRKRFRWSPKDTSWSIGWRRPQRARQASSKPVRAAEEPNYDLVELSRLSRNLETVC